MSHFWGKECNLYLSKYVSAELNLVIQDSTVDIATGYGLDKQKVGVQVLVGTRFFSSPCHPDWLCGPSSLLSNGHQGFFPWGVKLLECEAEHSPATSAKVKNTWIYTSIPPCIFLAVFNE
jgi:hypothetical protein